MMSLTKNFLQGVPLEKLQNLVAVVLKRSIFNPVLDKQKWVWEVKDLFEDVNFAEIPT